MHRVRNYKNILYLKSIKKIKCPTKEENTQRQTWKNSLEVWKVYEDCKNFTQESLFPKLSFPKCQNVKSVNPL